MWGKPKLSHSYPGASEGTKVLSRKGFLEPFLYLLSTLWQIAALSVVMCLYSLAASPWGWFFWQDVGAHHSSLFSPATILSPQISVSYKAELSPWGLFVVNWCSGLCWHSEDVLHSSEWSELCWGALVSQREIPEYNPCPTSEHIWSSRCPHLPWFSRDNSLQWQPSAHTGSGLLDFLTFLSFGTIQSYPNPTYFWQSGAKSLLFSLF